MNSLFLYLFESSVLLALLYGLYLLLLRRETFFNFNRFFLIAILVLAFLFPLLSFDLPTSGEGIINEQISELGKARTIYYTVVENWSDQPPGVATSHESWWQRFWYQDWSLSKVLMFCAVGVYFVGLFFLIGQHVFAYLKISILKRKLALTNSDGLKVVKIPPHMAPFSFLDTVFMPENIEEKSEFDQILAHEKTHIRQRHSIDLIFVQLVAAIIWFNPVIWLLIKSLKQTHEYIADRNMLQQGFSLVEYQSLLLRQLISNNSYGLVHNFNLSFIKKRITMMSIKESGWTGKSKAIVTLSLTLWMGIMTAKSNTLLDIPSLEIGSFSTETLSEMNFYIDGVLLKDGLKFSKLKGTKGEFTFNINNGQQDNIHVGVQLIRAGQEIGRVSGKLKEGGALKVDELLKNAKLDDYLVIDIISGPSEVAKLYNFPLFRESESWKKDRTDDLPPPPMRLSVNGQSVDGQNGISISQLRQRNYGAKLECELSEFVDFEVLAKQGGDVTTSLVRDGKVIGNLVTSGIKPKKVISLTTLLEKAQKGDAIVVQIGDPEGLSMGSSFPLQ